MSQSFLEWALIIDTVLLVLLSLVVVLTLQQNRTLRRDVEALKRYLVRKS